MRKILYSPEYGSGWTSCEYDMELKKFMLEYQPFIEALERGERITDDLVEAFEKECKARFGKTPYTGASCSLVVMEVSRRVRIFEYDGSESVEEEGDFQEWL